MNFLMASCLMAASALWQDEMDPSLEQKVATILRSLDDEQLPQRRDAENALAELGPAANQILDRVAPDLSADAQQAVARVQKLWDQQRANAMLKATPISLQGRMSLASAFRSLGNQAGVTIVGTDELADEIEVDLQGVEFWRALDQVMAGTSLSLYPYGAEQGELRVIDLAPEGKRPPPLVCYDGPFRIEAVRCESTRDYLRPSADQSRVILGINWEPRLRPIAFQQAMLEIEAVGDISEDVVRPQQADGVIEATVQPEIPYAEITLPFELAPPKTTQLSTLSGTMYAIIPSVPEKFQFDDLDEKSAGTEIRKGGLVVRFEGWSAEAEGSIFALRLRLHFDNENGALDSFRSWISNNQVELNDGMGTAYKPVGIEVSKQSAGEVAMRYLFQKDPTSLNLEYWSSTNIFKIPIKIDLRNLILP